jgi:RNA polymerase sigma-54 factor
MNSLSQNLSQRLEQKLSPHQIQLMKLLQIPAYALEQRIKEELESNPALEETEESDAREEQEANDRLNDDGGDIDTPERSDSDMDDFIKEYIEEDPFAYAHYNRKNTEEFSRTGFTIASDRSLHDYLEEQLGMTDLESEEQEVIALQIIGSIDDDGYLRRDLQSVCDDLLFAENLVIRESEVEEMLEVVQQFEPPGIASRNLQECLLIQMNRKLNQIPTEERLPAQVLAWKILKDHYAEFSKKHYKKLQKNLSITEDELKSAIEEILKFNPKPASGYSDIGGSNLQYIIPDFYVYNRSGDLELALNNRNVPDLKVSKQYNIMLSDLKVNGAGKAKASRDKKAVKFIKQKIDGAKWFIDAIQQRNATLQKTMYAIMQFQSDFFKTGDESNLKPMILKDIAEITALDISTISRVASSKYVQTEYGIKRLKDFFSESVKNVKGEDVSTREVKQYLTEVVEAEDKREPISDDVLTEMLLKKGYLIARRTVAKYRKQLNIPVARMRKEL